MSRPLDLALAVRHLDDVVADPRVWRTALDEVADVMGARGAMLLNPANQGMDMPFSADLAEALSIFVSEGWVGSEPRRRVIPMLLRDGAAIEETVFTLDEIKTLPFYRDFSARVDLPWWGVVGFNDGTDRYGLSVLRSARQGALDRDDLANLKRFSQRLSDVATLSRAAGREGLASVGDVLGQLGLAAIAVDRFGLVLDWNRRADACFGDGFRIVSRTLRISDPAAAATYEGAAARLCWLLDGAPLGCEPFVVKRRTRPHLLVKMVPVSGSARMPFGGARALVLVSPVATAGQAVEPRLLRQAFGLTPSEAGVAARLATGRSLREIAENSGLSVNTVRTHLRTIFEKTRTRRQGELVTLLGSLA